MKTMISIFLCFVLLSAICLGFASCTEKAVDTPDPKAKDYENALVLLANCDYVAAKAAFEKLGDYRDSEEYLSKFLYMPVSFEYDLIDKKGTNDIAYDSRNLPASETTMRPEAQAICKFVYDDNGNIIEQVMIKNTDSEPEVIVYKYTYDDNGRRTGANYTYLDNLIVSYTYEYDEKGNNIKQTYQDLTGAAEFFMTYDENGNVIRQETCYDGESSYVSMAYVLDDLGRTVREVRTYADGDSEYLDYTYDANGNLVKRTFTAYDGTQSTYDFTYDEHGNMIHELFTNADGSEQYVKIAYQLLYVPSGITDGTEMFFIEFWGNRL